MTRRLAFVSACLFVIACAGASASAAPSCDDSLWDHVFDAQRFVVLDPCAVYRGIVVFAMPQFDGDYHVLVRPDPGFEKFEPDEPVLNIEPICEIPIVSSPSAQQACGSWHQTLTVPPPGAHVEIVGAWVQDGGHGWREIHPVTSIRPLAKA